VILPAGGLRDLAQCGAALPAKQVQDLQLFAVGPALSAEILRGRLRVVFIGAFIVAACFAPFLTLAAFLVAVAALVVVGFPGATCAPCTATAAASEVLLASTFVFMR
jgi:hypothetical protein